MKNENLLKDKLRRIRDLRQSLGKGACGIGEIRDGKMKVYPISFGRCCSCNQEILGNPGANCSKGDLHVGYWNINDALRETNV